MKYPVAALGVPEPMAQRTAPPLDVIETVWPVCAAETVLTCDDAEVLLGNELSNGEVKRLATHSTGVIHTGHHRAGTTLHRQSDGGLNAREHTKS